MNSHPLISWRFRHHPRASFPLDVFSIAQGRDNWAGYPTVGSLPPSCCSCCVCPKKPGTLVLYDLFSHRLACLAHSFLSVLDAPYTFNLRLGTAFRIHKHRRQLNPPGGAPPAVSDGVFLLSKAHNAVAPAGLVSATAGPPRAGLILEPLCTLFFL